MRASVVALVTDCVANPNNFNPHGFARGDTIDISAASDMLDHRSSRASRSSSALMANNPGMRRNDPCVFAHSTAPANAMRKSRARDIEPAAYVSMIAMRSET